MKRRHDPLEEAMQYTVDILAEFARDNIVSGEGLARNAPSTIARKGRDAPLRDTDELMENLCGIVDVEKDGTVTGRLDAIGDENQKKLWINEMGWPGHIPARPIISKAMDEHGDEAMDEGLSLVMDDLEKLWGNK